MAHVDLHAELWRAMRIAKRSAGADPDALVSVLPFHAVQWGFTLVTYYGAARAFYEPQEDGEPALIVPVAEDGDTIDLCAIAPGSQHVGTRLGLGHGLGLNCLSDARCGCCVPLLVERPLSWLRQPVACLYLFNLDQLQDVLEGVAVFACDSVELSYRAMALLPPSECGRVKVRLP